MAKWKRRTYKMPQDHEWKAAPGNKIFVADRGAMQFEYPKDWILSFGESGSVRFFDREEADADIRLEVSLIYVPPIDWNGLSLARLLEDVALSDDPRGLTERGRFHEMRRANLEATWLEVGFTDAEEHRKAHSRICLARGPAAYSFITMDFWADADLAALARKVWNTVLDTLKLDGRNQDRLRLDGRQQPPKLSMN